MENQINEKSYGIFSTVANRKIINDLEGKGSKVFQFPVIETEFIESEEINDFIQNDLAQFDWLVFTDIFSVDYFIDLLEKLNIDLFELDDKRILVFGEAIADKLRFSQIHADLIPASVNLDNIFGSLNQYLQVEDLAGIKFFVPTSSNSSSKFVELLKEKSAEVFKLEIYNTRNNNLSELAKLSALLKGGAIDEFIFTAPDDIYNLCRLFHQLDLSEVLNETEVFAINEITMQTLHEHNINSKFYSNK